MMDRSDRMFWFLVGIFLAAGGVTLIVLAMPGWLAEILGGGVLLILGTLALRAGLKS